MRSRHASRRSNAADELVPLHRVTTCDELFGQMEVRAGESCSMVDVDHVATVEKRVDDTNDAPVRGMNRRSSRAGEIGPHVPRRNLPVVFATSAEPARYARVARHDERYLPESWRVVRIHRDFNCAL